MKTGKYMVLAIAVVALTVGLLSPRSARTQETSEDALFDNLEITAAAETERKILEAQNRAQEDHRRAQEEHRRAMDVHHRKIREMSMGSIGKGHQPHERNLRQQIAESAAAIRDAKDESARADATERLTEVLNQCFEEDMQVRAKELESIAARLQQLQQQLDRRRAKKQEIIDLQVKVAVNEADGLGFFGQQPVGNFNFDIATPVFVTAPQPAAWPTPPVPVTEPATAIPQ